MTLLDLSYSEHKLVMRWNLRVRALEGSNESAAALGMDRTNLWVTYGGTTKGCRSHHIHRSLGLREVVMQVDTGTNTTTTFESVYVALMGIGNELRSFRHIKCVCGAPANQHDISARNIIRFRMPSVER